MTLDGVACEEAINELVTISLTILAYSTFLSFVDVSSDYVQGFILYQDPELCLYGLITIAINWIPGIVASLHLVSYHRHELGTKKTLLWCGEFICYFP